MAFFIIAVIVLAFAATFFASEALHIRWTPGLGWTATVEREGFGGLKCDANTTV